MVLCSNRGRLSGAHVDPGPAIFVTHGTHGPDSPIRGHARALSRLAQDNMVTDTCQKFGDFVTTLQHKDHFPSPYCSLRAFDTNEDAVTKYTAQRRIH